LVVVVAALDSAADVAVVLVVPVSAALVSVALAVVVASRLKISYGAWIATATTCSIQMKPRRRDRF
jgi:hypothetical protein